MKNTRYWWRSARLINKTLKTEAEKLLLKNMIRGDFNHDKRSYCKNRK